MRCKYRGQQVHNCLGLLSKRRGVGLPIHQIDGGEGDILKGERRRREWLVPNYTKGGQDFCFSCLCGGPGPLYVLPQCFASNIAISFCSFSIHSGQTSVFVHPFPQFFKVGVYFVQDLVTGLCLVYFWGVWQPPLSCFGSLGRILGRRWSFGDMGLSLSSQGGHHGTWIIWGWGQDFCLGSLVNGLLEAFSCLCSLILH